MANRKPSDDSKEAVLQSSPRSGLNRDLGFGLHGRTDFLDPIARTRSGKIRISPSSNAVSFSTGRSNKRMKTSGSAEISMKTEGFGIDTPIVDDDIDGGHSEKILHVSPNPPTRRITRLLLKNLQESSISAAKKEVAGGSAVSEDAAALKSCDDGDGVVKKLELKMSKKIVLTELPLTIEDLLATGLLEGLLVKYVFLGNKVQLEEFVFMFLSLFFLFEILFYIWSLRYCS